MGNAAVAFRADSWAGPAEFDSRVKAGDIQFLAHGTVQSVAATKFTS